MRSSNKQQTNRATSALVRLLPGPLRRRIEHRQFLVGILDNFGWLFLDKILRMGVGLLVGVWIARYLGPAQYGQLNYAIAFVSMFGAIAGLGLNSIVVRDLVKHPDGTDNTLVTAFLLQTLGGLLTVVTIISVMAWLRPDDDFTRMMVAVLSFSLVFKSTDVVRYWFEAQVQSRYAVWVENAVFVLVSIVKIGAILMALELMAFVWISLFEAMFASFGLIAIGIAKGWRIRLPDASFQRAMSLLKDSWPLLLSGLSVMIYMRIDMVMLEEISGNWEVGIYAAATRISEIWYFLPMIIVSSVTPYIIRFHTVDPILYLQRMRSLYFIMAWLATIVSLLLSIFSSQIVRLLFGDQFEDAAPVLAIHLWASLAVFLGVASSQHLIAEQLQVVSLYRTLIGLVCNVGLNLILIPEMGSRGAAVATVISYFAATFSLVLFRATRQHAIHMMTAPFDLTIFQKSPPPR